jgi:hypothetical protein
LNKKKKELDDLITLDELFFDIIDQTPKDIPLKIQKDFIEKNMRAALIQNGMDCEVTRIQDFTEEGCPEKWRLVVQDFTGKTRYEIY